MADAAAEKKQVLYLLDHEHQILEHEEKVLQQAFDSAKKEQQNLANFESHIHWAQTFIRNIEVNENKLMKLIVAQTSGNHSITPSDVKNLYAELKTELNKLNDFYGEFMHYFNQFKHNAEGTFRKEFGLMNKLGELFSSVEITIASAEKIFAKELAQK